MNVKLNPVNQWISLYKLLSPAPVPRNCGVRELFGHHALSQKAGPFLMRKQ